MCVAACLALTLLATSISESDCRTLYTSLEYRYTGGRYEGQVFRYRLLDPRTDDSDRQFPLIVWLHGLGEGGDDNVSQLHYVSTFITPAPWHAGRWPFFVLALQCPKENPSWCEGDLALDEGNLPVLARVLEATLDTYPIDRDRVYLTGVSDGGGGCWRFASWRPDLFAAVAPLSGGIFEPTSEEIVALTQMPVWVFNCTADGASPIDEVRQMVEILKTAGANIHLSEIPIASHDSWTPAFADYGLRDWLLAQRRGDSSAPLPGTIGWFQAMLIFYHGPFCEPLRGWTWLQMSALGYLATVIAVIGVRTREGRWFLKKLQIRAQRVRSER
jgi:predicted esterase